MYTGRLGNFWLLSILTTVVGLEKGQGLTTLQQLHHHNAGALGGDYGGNYLG